MQQSGSARRTYFVQQSGSARRTYLVALSLRERKAQLGPRFGCLPLAEREGYYFLPIA